MIQLSYLLIFLSGLWTSDPFPNGTTKDNNLDSLAVKLFELFKEREWNTIVDKYFLNEAECERFNKLILPNKRNPKINYTRDSITVLFTDELKKNVDIAINHNVNLDQLELISVKKIYSDKKIFSEDYKDKLLVFEIYCTDQKINYFLTIAPLVKSRGQWKVYLTEFNLRQELKEEK